MLHFFLPLQLLICSNVKYQKLVVHVLGQKLALHVLGQNECWGKGTTIYDHHIILNF